MSLLASFTSAFIDWNVPDSLSLGFINLRYYSTCWIIGLALGYFLVQRFYKDQHLKDADFEPLFFYCFIGILAGARLGHCLFYEPDYYIHHAIEMFFPIKEVYHSEQVHSWLNWVPCTHGGVGWHFIGYEGLASHGGGIGLIIALIIYARKTGIRVWQVMDNIAIVLPLTGCFIRLGNLMNSEIVGSVTDVPWAFIFHSNSALLDGQLVPRHPSQLYEAIFYLILFIAAILLYKKKMNKVGTGFYVGFSLAGIFIFRFLIEFIKEVQGGVDDGSSFINMGQMLSIPFIIVGIYLIIRSCWLQNNSNKE